MPGMTVTMVLVTVDSGVGGNADNSDGTGHGGDSHGADVGRDLMVMVFGDWNDYDGVGNDDRGCGDSDGNGSDGHGNYG